MDVFDAYEDAWLRTNLAKLAFMSAQLRDAAERREQEQRAHLRLTAHFDELAMEPPHRNSEDETV